jgi:ribonuclease BN (tRNA processing enzyme)
MRVHLYGQHANDTRTCGLLSGQMSSEFFPVSFNDLGARIVADHLDDGRRNIEGVEVSSFPHNHPGGCFGFCFAKDGRKIVYSTDNELEIQDGELFPDLENTGLLRRVPEALVQAMKDADLLILDAQYDEKEYATKKKWGHSTCFSATDLAIQAGAKNLAIFHHDPDATDRAVDAKVESCRQRAARLGSPLKICAAREGVELKF